MLNNPNKTPNTNPRLNSKTMLINPNKTYRGDCTKSIEQVLIQDNVS